jgi:hypothetical protein
MQTCYNERSRCFTMKVPVSKDAESRFALSQTAKTLATELARCVDLINSRANPELFRMISFQLQRAGLHIGNAARAAERGLDGAATVATAADSDGVMT